MASSQLVRAIVAVFDTFDAASLPVNDDATTLQVSLGAPPELVERNFVIVGGAEDGLGEWATASNGTTGVGSRWENFTVRVWVGVWQPENSARECLLRVYEIIDALETLVRTAQSASTFFGLSNVLNVDLATQSCGDPQPFGEGYGVTAELGIHFRSRI